MTWQLETNKIALGQANWESTIPEFKKKEEKEADRKLSF